MRIIFALLRRNCEFANLQIRRAQTCRAASIIAEMAQQRASFNSTDLRHARMKRLFVLFVGTFGKQYRNIDELSRSLDVGGDIHQLWHINNDGTIFLHVRSTHNAIIAAARLRALIAPDGHPIRARPIDALPQAQNASLCVEMGLDPKTAAQWEVVDGWTRVFDEVERDPSGYPPADYGKFEFGDVEEYARELAARRRQNAAEKNRAKWRSNVHVGAAPNRAETASRT